MPSTSPATTPTSGVIARQARELGITRQLMGGDGWDSEKLFELGGSAMEGSYFTNHYSPEDPDPAIQKFIADYKAAYGAVPDALAALGYDAAKVAVDAHQARAADLDRAAIRDAIAATKDFPGVTGSITLDAEPQRHQARGGAEGRQRQDASTWPPIAP